MRKLAWMVMAAVMLMPAAMSAQVCLGYPATRGQSDVGGVLRLQSHMTQLGGTYGGHYPTDVVADALLTWNHFSLAGEHSDGFTAAGRLGLELHSPVLPPALSLCPHVGLGLTHFSGSNAVTIPVGIGVGTMLPLTGGARLRTTSRFAAPATGAGLLIFATPAVAYTHMRFTSDTYALAEIGARYVVASAYFGASVIVAGGGRDAVLGLTAGVPLPF